MKGILIVDDQQGIRMLLNEVFKKEGFTTYLAANGFDAIKIAQENELGCVLLDMKIPGMDGLEILARLKEEHPELPVMMMTAYVEQHMMDTANELGVLKYFTKPFNIFEVRDEVNKLVEKAEKI
ncbi:two-component system response regulator (stage 0 sporulation protein F) [Solibacillus kalamii]|uniref:Two-component system response regulator n=1 Tax=Solibacillus kalamii TaxID=1748298 RepID=A0ABX3ZMN5_9BACL|nr:response regulator [Solibacillus kalamii]MBM7664762.1 two-component system response regulator (stage 0 sporulation protein F) [Solibacillus kalamii]OUZ40862.1 two-component system response regulator [Solibacillus kalamii]